MAAAVSGPSLYFPVPTMRRERKVRPAMVKVLMQLFYGERRKARLDGGPDSGGELLRLT